MMPFARLAVASFPPILLIFGSIILVRFLRKYIVKVPRKIINALYTRNVLYNIRFSYRRKLGGAKYEKVRLGYISIK